MASERLERACVHELRRVLRSKQTHSRFQGLRGNLENCFPNNSNPLTKTKRVFSYVEGLTEVLRVYNRTKGIIGIKVK